MSRAALHDDEMYRALTTPPARTSTRARAGEPDGRARSTDARSRANLVRVTPCVGEVFRAECLGVVSRPSGDAEDDVDVATSRDDADDSSETRAMARRVFFATNALGAMAAATTTMDGVANAFEEVPKDYAKLAREVVETLSASLEYEAANANASPGERFKLAKPAKEAVKAYISYDKGGGSVKGSTSYVDISEALRELSAFYKTNGATAFMASDTRERILGKLYEARDSLPPAEPSIMDKLLQIGVKAD